MSWASWTESGPQAESDWTAATLTQFVAELRALGDGPPPDPTPEVEALLRGSSVATLAAWRQRSHRAIVIGTVAAAVITGTGVAAATDTLPRPAQRFVSGVVNDYTPLHIDAPGMVPRTPHLRPIPRPKPSPANGDVVAPPAKAPNTVHDDDSRAPTAPARDPSPTGTRGRAEDSAATSEHPAPGASDHPSD
ncbi:MAG: hypothetical protein M3Y44_04795 [Actinomycetota bacterium]|nr:hypothetical protein [Actinomycetota bacterium]